MNQQQHQNRLHQTINRYNGDQSQSAGEASSSSLCKSLFSTVNDRCLDRPVGDPVVGHHHMNLANHLISGLEERLFEQQPHPVKRFNNGHPKQQQQQQLLEEFNKCDIDLEDDNEQEFWQDKSHQEHQHRPFDDGNGQPSDMISYIEETEEEEEGDRRLTNEVNNNLVMGECEDEKIDENEDDEEEQEQHDGDNYNLFECCEQKQQPKKYRHHSAAMANWRAGGRQLLGSIQDYVRSRQQNRYIRQGNSHHQHHHHHHQADNQAEDEPEFGTSASSFGGSISASLSTTTCSDCSSNSSFVCPSSCDSQTNRNSSSSCSGSAAAATSKTPPIKLIMSKMLKYAFSYDYIDHPCSNSHLHTYNHNHKRRGRGVDLQHHRRYINHKLSSISHQHHHHELAADQQNLQNLHNLHNLSSYGQQAGGFLSSSQLQEGPYTKNYGSSSSGRKKKKNQAYIGHLGHKLKLIGSSCLARTCHSPALLLALVFSFILTSSLVCLMTIHSLQQQQQQQQQQSSAAFINHLNQSSLSNGSSGASVKGSDVVTPPVPSLVLVERLNRFDRAKTVETECGKFIGTIEDEAIVFKGIPYALPPVGSLRWSRPVPIWHRHWQPPPTTIQQSQPPHKDGHHHYTIASPNNNTTQLNDQDKQPRQPEDSNRGGLHQSGRPHRSLPSSKVEHTCQPGKLYRAQEHGAICQQLSPLSHKLIGHEDCLYLDIWAPRLDTKRRPVMVYIHGGFLSFGSSGQGEANVFEMGPSANLALAMDCIIVSFNYRLQALGFLALEQLSNEGPNASQGNYGLWDQLTALRWVKRNIIAFGGDPNNIILFGPDSASALPLALLTNEMTDQPTPTTTTSLGAPHDGGGHSSTVDEITNPPMMITSASNPSSSWKTGGFTSNEGDGGGEDSQLIEDERQLYHAIWLTNPTLYFDVPFFVAAKHNQHAFLHKLPCYRHSTTTIDQHSISILNDNDGNELSSSSTSNDSTENHHQHHNQHHKKTQSELDLECLYSLSSEEVIRHFLGQDDPSYRLDDQNDLPIHGIFADQFVVLDNELVRNPFPFTANIAPITTTATITTPKLKSSASPSLAVADNSTRIDNSSSLKNIANQQNTSQAPKRKITTPMANSKVSSRGSSRRLPSRLRMNRLARNKRVLLGSSQQAVEFWPCPRDIQQWSWQDFSRYVVTSLNSFSSDAAEGASSLYDHILSLTAPQSINETINRIIINQTDNQLSPSASEPSKNETTIHQGVHGPMENYLTLVSDMRQICPINELMRQLASTNNQPSTTGGSSSASKTTGVHRYIIDHRPDKALWMPNRSNVGAAGETESGSSSTLESSKLSSQEYHQPRMAFHMWDLMAFFGLERSPHFKPTGPSKRELEFQQMIRQMVRTFIHLPYGEPNIQTTNQGIQLDEQLIQIWLSNGSSSPSKGSPSINETASLTSEDVGHNSSTTTTATNTPTITTDGKIALIGRDGQLKLVDTYKERECKMWRKYLGRDYAWVS